MDGLPFKLLFQIHIFVTFAPHNGLNQANLPNMVRFSNAKVVNDTTAQASDSLIKLRPDLEIWFKTVKKQNHKVIDEP